MTSTTSAWRPDAGTPWQGEHDPESAVSAADLVKTYGRGASAVRAVDGVTVGFERGRFTAIMGRSGSGKSTLMHCLAGLDTATSGKVRMGDIDLTTLSDAELTRLRRERVGFVFQSFNLLPMLTARQNVLLPFRLAGKEPDWAWFDSVVDVLGLLARMRHRPGDLSGGERQRVAVARALVTRPDVVFADEPTGNLDSRSGEELLSFLRTSVAELGQTVIMVTHDPAVAARSDRVVLLADGRLAGELRQPTRNSVLEALRPVGA